MSTGTNWNYAVLLKFTLSYVHRLDTVKKFRRIIWALQLFAGIAWRELPDGSRMGIRHAWQTAQIFGEAKGFLLGLMDVNLARDIVSLG